MHGLAHDVVDAGGEQAERVVERGPVAQAEHRRLGSLADQLGEMLAPLAVADKERFDGLDVAVARLLQPLAELDRIDSGCGDALAVETRGVTPRHYIPVVHDNIHLIPAVLISPRHGSVHAGTRFSNSLSPMGCATRS